MDNEKKIEIPFGAFDSELIHQEINIPKGFKAVIDGNKIILTRAESEGEKVRKALVEMVHDTTGDELWVDYNVHKEDALAWLEKQGEVESDNDDIEVEEKGIREAFNKIEDEKQCKQKPQRMISAEAKEAMYNKPADTVEPKCEESKTKIFDAPTPFEDKLYAFVAACEFLAIPSKIEFILEHSQEILDAAREQIGKEQEFSWSKEDEKMVDNILTPLATRYPFDIYQPMYNWLKSLKDRVGCEVNCTTTKEWSEEDEETMRGLLSFLLINTPDQWAKYGKWLKSLKLRCAWKPSDKQIQAVRLARAFVTDDFSENPTLSDILVELEEQLKKLREE